MNKIIKVILVNACLVAVSASFIYGMSMLKNDGDDQASSTAIKKAPLFTAKDSNGKTHNLADYKGKIVVLEWKNHLCPFVKKHYGVASMIACSTSHKPEFVNVFSNCFFVAS